MTNHALSLRVLSCLLHLEPADRPDAGVLAAVTGRSVTEVGAALVRLERQGLVDAERLRPTLRGLAVASALRGQAGPLRTVRAARRRAGQDVTRQSPARPAGAAYSTRAP